MAIEFTLVEPTSTINAEVDTEVVIDITSPDPIDESKISASVDDGDGLVVAYSNNAFQNAWEGEIIDNNPGSADDFTLVLIRPLPNPLYNYDTLISVIVAADIL